MEDTTMRKEQWGPGELITTLDVALREHTSWGRLH